MTGEWARLLTEHWPTLTLTIAVLIGIYYVVRTLALTFDAVADALGPLGKIWRARRTISQAESTDLRRRVEYLDSQVRALRYRDECYFAYTLMDHDWHVRNELLAREHGLVLERHVTFLEFRDKWMRDHQLENEDIKIWQ
ncbi:hypothetical protein A5747_13250 [Mycobacterium sp. IS-836]|uniref:hypothetical protein n=1 Tax=Mycobacterium sp. IS-836 TaxID=1834160 RepID=UPI00096CF40A|nr:hypothetical protein [Mycobacterium sp. IS-836]OMC55356.1 hypothetical protein A5747_13250 [Mycobacterium sp. IS-836]